MLRDVAGKLGTSRRKTWGKLNNKGKMHTWLVQARITMLAREFWDGFMMKLWKKLKGTDSKELIRNGLAVN